MKTIKVYDMSPGHLPPIYSARITSEARTRRPIGEPGIFTHQTEALTTFQDLFIGLSIDRYVVYYEPISIIFIEHLRKKNVRHNHNELRLSSLGG